MDEDAVKMHIHHTCFSWSGSLWYIDDVYTSLPSRIDPCACTTVKKVSRVLGRHYDSTISPAGVNITQLAVLRCIARRVGEPLVRVAEEMEMDRTSLYRAIAPMIRDGWLTSEDASTSRFRTAEITAKGRKLLTVANKRWERVQRNIIGKFGQREYGKLLAELDRLAECAVEE
ncbi:MarR family winged helix-turn-helix transcriptional regulator [Terriglobus saanensis]|uniref:MarR family winged helix-turn-helix transcriptional regulator n=1 Tax=Terriglobus saanensis TaxID=870903 RepID=UPI003CCACE15